MFQISDSSVHRKQSNPHCGSAELADGISGIETNLHGPLAADEMAAAVTSDTGTVAGIVSEVVESCDHCMKEEKLEGDPVIVIDDEHEEQGASLSKQSNDGTDGQTPESPKNWICAVCQKHFRHPDDFSSHLLVVHGVKIDLKKLTMLPSQPPGVTATEVMGNSLVKSASNSPVKSNSTVKSNSSSPMKSNSSSPLRSNSPVKSNSSVKSTGEHTPEKPIKTGSKLRGKRYGKRSNMRRQSMRGFNANRRSIEMSVTSNKEVRSNTVNNTTAGSPDRAANNTQLSGVLGHPDQTPAFPASTSQSSFRAGQGHRCHICLEVFTHSATLTKHLKADHMDHKDPPSDNQLYGCYLCSIVFKDLQGLHQHMSTKHQFESE